MTTLVFGPDGFLGRQLVGSLPGAWGSAADIADPNVDWCETHREETIRSNVTGPLVLLDECQRRQLYLVHLSTGCLFQGDNGGRGFAEVDPPNFFGSYYVRSKVYADQILSEYPVLILRPRMPFDDSLHERTLLGKLIRYRRVLDAANSLTYIPDFLRATQQLIAARQEGIFHVVNPGVTSPFEVMQRYRERVDPDHRFERLLPDQLAEVAEAPRSSCVLSADKLIRSGITMRPVSDAIESALTSIT